MRLDVRDDARVKDVLDHLRGLPGATRLPPSPLVALNERYTTAETSLADGDEVAVIPPVAGG